MMWRHGLAEAAGQQLMVSLPLYLRAFGLDALRGCSAGAQHDGGADCLT